MARAPRQSGFAAAFHGVCHRCDRDILPGQRIIKLDLNRFIHVGCASGQDDI